MHLLLPVKDARIPFYGRTHEDILLFYFTFACYNALILEKDTPGISPSGIVL